MTYRRLVGPPLVTLLGILAIFIVQLALVWNVPSWGLHSGSPYSAIRNIAMPLLLGFGTGVPCFFAEQTLERQLLLSITIASILQVLLIVAMVRLDQRLLMLPIFLTSAFATVQLVKFGWMSIFRSPTPTDA